MHYMYDDIRLEHQMKSYRDLEEEFRTALRIEAARYEQVVRYMYTLQKNTLKYCV